MESIEVVARFGPDGRITPVEISWKGQTYPVNQVGRRWKDGTGEHFLVMIPVEKVVELVFSPVESLWFVHTPVLGNRSTI
jgi:hypothetical protein